ncbi:MULTISPECIES: DUF7507 domain-containing protein [Nocardioides]|uniref:DUF11 domain-containing protein n=1 Tax=Nocardioides vastitatis TaxID=2568655 RepID=A0ABW0ZL19_9ACTN|nr:hypothetical protein [Nocardioides sp.]THI93501.1 hypothetical protein E7Z54_20780 [Nocardioides sp.]
MAASRSPHPRGKSDVRRRRWSALRLAGAALVPVASLVAVVATAPIPGVTPAAQAAPGVPVAPTTLYTENFENRAANSNLLLTDYTGSSGMTYTGSSLWVNRANCNGFIINRTSPTVAGDCGSAATYDNLTALPHALGILAGAANPSANAAAAAYTSSNGADGLIQFRTAAPLTLPSASGRFVTFSVDAAAVNCWAPDQPRLRFYLVDGSGVERPVSSTPINPCIDAGGQDITALSANGNAHSVRAGRFSANGSMLMTGNTLGIVMRNEEGGGYGNDGAYDNIRVLDVTPTLDKSFTPTRVTTGGTSTLTFTITNTSELGSKEGWSFTDALPSGLTIAPGNTSTTCPSGAVSAPAGGTSVSVTGNLSTGMVSCTVTVDVTSDTTGTYTNGPDNVTLTGLNPPGTSSVAFSDPSISLVKSASPSSAAAYRAGEVIEYSFLVTNTGDVPLSDVGVSETAFSGSGAMSAIDCPSTTLAVGASMTCTADYTWTQADVDAGSVDNTARATGTDPYDVTVTDNGSVSVPATSSPGLTLLKSADRSSVSAVGEVITYSFLVTNSGNVTIDDVTIDEGAFTGTGSMSAISCPSAPVAPGDQLTCTATYAVTQADLDADALTNTATAAGFTPTGVRVESPQDSATVTTADDPGLSIVKNAAPASALAAGDEITYSFLVTNTGNVTIDDVAIDEGAFSGTGSMSAISCPPAAASVAPDDQVTCTATYTMTQADIDAGDLTNTATASGNPPSGPRVESPPDTATVVTPDDPALTVVKTADPDAADAVGDEITYSFLVTNTGNVTMDDVTIDEGAFTGTGSLSPISCPPAAASVAPGGDVTCTATYELTQADVDAGGVTNTATATGTPPSGTPVDSPPSTSTVTITPAPALTVDKSAVPGTVSDAGDVVTYRFLVTNSGNVTIDDVAIDETAFSGAGQLSAITCPATSLVSSAQMTCTATYEVTQADVDNGELTNTATVTGTPPSGPPVESPPDTATVTTPDRPELSLVKSASPTGPGTLKAGAEITYSFQVTNTGNVTMTDVSVEEQSFSGSGPMSAISCPPGTDTLAPGGQMTCTATYTVTQDDVDAGGITNVAAGTGTPPAGPPVQSPPDEVTVTEPASPALSLVKSSDADRLTEVGQEITYSFLVTNTGNVTLTAVAVDEGAFTGSGELSPVTCPAAAASMAPGEQITCSATYTVTQADLDQDSITNTATATGTPPSGPRVASSPDTVDLPSTGRGVLELTKRADAIDVDGDGTVGAGDRIDWDIEVTNVGTATVRDVTVSDPTAGKVRCPRTTLRPGRSMTCTVRAHTVTAADMADGRVRNTATATGSDVGGVSVTSDDGSATVALSSNDDGPLPDTGAGVLLPGAGIAGGLAVLSGLFLLLWGRRRSGLAGELRP